MPRPSPSDFARSAGLSLLVITSLWLATSTSHRSIHAQDGPDPSSLDIETELIASGFQRPVDIANAGDGSGRLFIVEKVGRIRIIQADGSVATEPFLDISDRVNSGANERGLLGLAFHPEYGQNGYFYVNYTTSRSVAGTDSGDTIVARYSLGDGTDQADPDSEKILLTLDQPYSNHNGGDLLFGPDDGYLYISTGDGGRGGDPLGAGQDKDRLLAKLLRIDVDGGDPYAIPPDNPFVGEEGAQPEIWAWGLRNPWRIAFDLETFDLYIADVGQNAYEEVNFEPADSPGGVNYGWNLMEGMHCYNRPTCNEDGDLTLPVFEYGRSLGQSITGGEVYRGSRYPGLDGAYFVADYVTGRLWALSRDAQGEWRDAQVGNLGFGPTSFGLDEAGEIYVAYDSNENTPTRGQIHRLVHAGGDTVTPTTEPTDEPTPDPGSDLVAPGAEVEQLSSGHTFTEGPAADDDGRIYFSDVQQSRIHILDPDGSVSTYRDDIQQPNGLYFDADGRLVICSMGQRAILRDDLAGSTEPLADAWDGKRLNRTNDVFIDPAGGIWFTDPIYGGPPDPQEIPTEQVYFIPPGGGPVVQVTDDLIKPNGLIGSPNGRTLYVTDPGSSQTWRYEIELDEGRPTGRLLGKTLFAEAGGDGMTIDERGNVYLATDVVRVYAPSGDEILEIDVPERPSNLTFGGEGSREDRKTLYITARTGLYALAMNVAAAFGPPDPDVPTSTPTSTPVGTEEPSATPTATLDIDLGFIFLPRLEQDRP